MVSTRILITGVGSLVGTGLLDVLEGRRGEVEILGTTFSPMSPGAYRCDQVFLTEPSESRAFPGQLAEIIAATQPDVVIPARDPDIAVLADLKAVLPEVPALVGTPAAAELFADKLATYRFARGADLRIVPTVLASDGPIAPPAVVKPRRGSGSIGVRVLLTESQVQQACATPDAVLQPLMGAAPEVPDVSHGWPLFWQLQPARQGGVHGVILPDGEVGPSFAFEVIHVSGKVDQMWSADDAELQDVGQSFLTALADAGWRGPANVACVHSGQEWMCLELNGRFTGGTAARTALGFDEVALFLNAWVGREVVPSRSDAVHGRVFMQPRAATVASEDSVLLAEHATWPSA